MKTLFTLILLFAILQTNAQSGIFDEDFNKRQSLIDSVAAALGSNFRHVKTDSITIYSNTEYFEYLRDTAGQAVIIHYLKVYKGENKDLGKTGIPIMRNVRIYGSYLSLFTIWERFVDPKADVEKLLQSARRDVPVGKVTARLYPYQDRWMLYW